jgi:hypothetical protein
MGAFVAMKFIAFKTGHDWFVILYMSHHITNRAVKTAIFVFDWIKFFSQCHLMRFFAKAF